MSSNGAQGHASGEAPDALTRLNVALVIGIALVSGILGLVLLFQPVLLAAFALVLGYAALCLSRKQQAFAVFMFALVAIPIYLRPPLPLPLPPAAIVLLMMLAATCLGERILHGPGRPLAADGKRLLFWFLVWGAVSMSSLYNERVTVEGVNMWVKAVVFPLLVILTGTWVLRRAADIHLALRALLAAAVLTSLYAVYEYYVGENWLIQNFMTGEGGWSESLEAAEAMGPQFSYRSFSVFSQPIEFGTCLGMIFPYAVVMMATHRRPEIRWVYGAAALVCAAGVTATFSRMPMMALFAGAVVVAVQIPRLRLALLGVFLAGGVGLALAWPWLGEIVRNRVADADNVTVRFKLWETALAIFADHPIRGVGIGTFPEHQIDAIRSHMIGPFSEFGGTNIEKIRVAESSYMQLTAEMGILGILAFGTVVTILFTTIIRLSRRSLMLDERQVVLAIGAGALVYFLNSLTITGYTHFVATMLLFGAIFTFAIVLDRETAGKPPHGGARVARPTPHRGLETPATGV